MKVPNSQEILYLDVNLSDILKFVTGAPAPPLVGFTPTPTIQFHVEYQFPIANTCSNTLYLPLPNVSDEEFKYNVLSGIINGVGFGTV